MPKKIRQKIKIDITDEDCHDLLRGKEFNWTFPTEVGGERIDIHLFNPEAE